MGINLLVTGRPDPLIAELIDNLAEIHPIDKLWFVIAPEDVEEAITYLPHLPPLRLLIGDFRMQSLGLKSPIEIWESATHLIHLYEYKDFSGKFPKFFSANIEALKNTMAFAMKIKSLKQAIFLSTVYVSGLGSGTFPELIIEHDNPFRNHYEHTKYFAEIEIQKKMHLLPITIVRIPFVVFCYERSNWVSYARFIRNYIKFSSPILGAHYIGDGIGSFNFIDFDTLKRAFNGVFDNSDAIGRVYNIVGEPVTSDEVLDIFASVYSKSLRGRLSLNLLKNLTAIAGRGLSGIPIGLLNYFDSGPNYEHQNMLAIGINPPERKIILSRLRQLALGVCREINNVVTL